jgi:predicted nuclease with TOPRIM domain
MRDVEERVDRLEQLIAHFVTNVGIEFNKLYNSQMRTEAELREFKDEMRTFKDEMRGFKDESRRQVKEMNLKWGELANKLGTLSEDLVAPSLPRVIREVFGVEVTDLMPRRKTRLPDGRRKEFDAIAFASDLIFLTSVRREHGLAGARRGRAAHGGPEQP